jgi:hypothetical protein
MSVTGWIGVAVTGAATTIAATVGIGQPGLSGTGTVRTPGGSITQTSATARVDSPPRSASMPRCCGAAMAGWSRDHPNTPMPMGHSDPMARATMGNGMTMGDSASMIDGTMPMMGSMSGS